MLPRELYPYASTINGNVERTPQPGTPTGPASDPPILISMLQELQKTTSL